MIRNISLQICEMEMPRETAAIFEYLSRGQFLSVNTQDPSKAHLYRILADHEARYHGYFGHLGLRLKKGPGYYYFSRDENRSVLEDKVEKLMRWLDWLDWLVQYRPDVGPGVRLTLAEMLEATQHKSSLSRQLRKISLKGNPQNDEDRLVVLMRNLEREGLIETTQEKPLRYQVLAAMDYAIQLLGRIQPLNGNKS